MAGGSYNDLRRLSHDIERKKKAAEENKKKAQMAHRESLSKQMDAEKKQRVAKAEKIAATSHLVRNVVLISLVGGIAILAIVLVKSMVRDEGPKKTAVLLIEDFKSLNASNDEYLKANKFVQNLIQACKNDETKVIWSPAVIASQKERSQSKLLELGSGNWVVSRIDYNEKLGFFSIVLTDNENKQTINLRITEGKNYQLELAKAY